MSPEELNRKVEFLIENQAKFAIRQERDHAMLVRGFDRLTRDVADLRQTTAQFQMSAAELIVIHSNRLERQDKIQETVLRQIVHLLNLILDRLPPASTHEAT